jgi:hypothetical protein
MISISTKTFDLAGSIQLTPAHDSELVELVRRVSRSATLDGGATFEDMGFSWSDVSLDLRFDNLTQAQADQLGYICQNYGELIYIDKNGAFLVLLESSNFGKGGAQIKLLIVGEA